MKNSSPKDPQYRVQVIDRVLDILEILADENSAMTQTEISRRLTLPKSTAHRLLSILERRRYVGLKFDTGKYHLGLKLLELGSKAATQIDLGERARPFLEQLVFETDETAHFCTLDEGEVVYLEKKEPQRAIRMSSSPGGRNPAHCTAVGKAILAFLPEEQLNEIIKRRGLRAYTRNTITTPRQLKDELQIIRQRGYSVDNEEHEEGVQCIGAPVRDHSGRVVASISIAGPSFRLTDDKIPMLATSVIRVANEVSVELGYRSTTD
jgi:DNA-binding IclR family transcriptional regulator